MVVNSLSRRRKGKKRGAYEIIEPEIKSQDRRKMPNVGMGSAKKMLFKRGSSDYISLITPAPEASMYPVPTPLVVSFRNYQ